MSSWGEIALKNARKNDEIKIIDSAQPQNRQDLSKLLPEGSKLEVRFMQLWAAMNGPKLDREIT